jgi:hypothetical protein
VSNGWNQAKDEPIKVSAALKYSFLYQSYVTNLVVSSGALADTVEK